MGRADHAPREHDSRLSPGRRAAAFLLGACCLALLLSAAPDAQAQTTLVSNTGQSQDAASTGIVPRAQAFTTGTNSDGYTLTGVGISVTGAFSTASVKIESSNASNRPGGSLGSLAVSSTYENGVQLFTSTGIELDANTTYFVVWGVATSTLSYRRTNSDSEDSGAAAGWSIGDGSLWKNSPTGSWQTSNQSLQMAIHGTAKNTPPTVANQIPDQTAATGTAFSFTFNENTFNDANSGDTLTYTAAKSDDTALPSWLSFDASTRTFSGTPAAADVGTVSVKVTASDGNGGSVSDTFDIVVTVRDAPPRFTGGVAAMRLAPGEEMTPVTLPAASGGNGGPYTYALTSAPAGLAGLSFDPNTRVLSGTPEEEGRWTFTYTAHDGDANTALSDAARLTFRVTVGAADEQRRRVVKRSLAAVATRTVVSALDNVGARLGDAVPAPTLTLAGESTRFGGSGTAARGGTCPDDGFGPRGFETGAGACARGDRGRGVTPDELLRTSAFSLTLGAAEGEPGFDPHAARWSLWVRGDFGTFAGRPEPGMRYEGELRTGWLGVDAREGRWVAGLAASHGVTDSDYSFDGGDDPAERGRLKTALTALWPYGRWTFDDGLELRGMLGAGRGRLRHLPGGGDAPEEKSDLTMWTVSLGLRQKLPPLGGIALAARGDASVARIETAKGPQEIDGLRADTWRGRAGLEASRRFEAESGRTFTPFLEAAARQDGGDGLTGSGLEVAGGLRYAAPGVEVEARGRMLAAHTQGGASERGVSLTARVGPGAQGRGLSLSLAPRWGAAPGGARALWRNEMPRAADAGAANGNEAAMDMRIGYGVAPAPGGLLTPFAETGLAGGGGDRRLRLGTRFDAPRINLGAELSGERRESANAAPGHAVRLDLMMRF